jgi:hypothetical protein
VNDVRRFAIGLAIAGTAAIVAAETLPTVTFENFSQGSPNGQYGWKSTGSDGPSCAGPSYDHMVAPNRTRFTSFGRQSLRISNAVASNCLHDQTYSAPVINEAGEKAAYTDMPSGVRQPFFVFEFDFASMLPAAPQEGLVVAVSADKGDGGRLSWVELADTAEGLEITFADYQDMPPYGSRTNPANGRGPEDHFVFTTVAAALDRAAKHHVRLEHYFYDGPRNDVVIVSVDQGAFVHRGTSWEDYFRWVQGPGDPQQTAPVRESRVARTIEFQTRNAPAPNTLGFGFEFDNVKQASGPIPASPSPDHECKHDRHHSRRGHHQHDGRDCDDDRDHGHGNHDGHGGRDCDDDHDRNHGHDGRDHDDDRDGHNGRDDDRRDNHDRDDGRGRGRNPW